MKVGILTFHRAHNYGALLQCYALKEYISSLGHEVSIIDYWPEYHSKTYNLLPDFSKKSFKGKVKSLILFSLSFYIIIKRSMGYKYFIKNYLNLEKTIKYKTAKELNNLIFDVVVYGSDQIWWKSTLPNFKGYDLVYWGENLVNVKKKISYAPSMGIINFKDEELIQLKKSIKTFDTISVRELAAQQLLKEKMEIESEIVLDPVFLLDRRNWERICNSKPSPIRQDKKYVLFYQLINNEKASELANQIAENTNCYVIEIRGRVTLYTNNTKIMQTIDPIGFVQLIRHAQFIVTTSFHGTALSIIFEKQFVTLGMGLNSERARSLLRNLNIENRYIDEIYNFRDSETINYYEVNILLDSLKEKSKKFLSNNI